MQLNITVQHELASMNYRSTFTVHSWCTYIFLDIHHKRLTSIRLMGVVGSLRMLMAEDLSLIFHFIALFKIYETDWSESEISTRIKQWRTNENRLLDK